MEHTTYPEYRMRSRAWCEAFVAVARGGIGSVGSEGDRPVVAVDEVAH